VRQSSPRLEKRLDLPRRIGGQRYEARLKELRGSDPERLLGRIVVADVETNEFAPSKPRGVEQDDGEAVHLPVEGGLRRGRQVSRGLEKVHDLRVGEEVGATAFVSLREDRQIRDEAGRDTPSPVDAQFADEDHAFASDARSKMPEEDAPAGEGLRGEIGGEPDLGKELVQMGEDPLLVIVLPAKGAHVGEVGRDIRSKGGEEHHLGSHGRASSGSWSATSRSSSTWSRRYTPVLSTLRWPKRSPIVLSGVPWRRRCTAREWRMQCGP